MGRLAFLGAFIGTKADDLSDEAIKQLMKTDPVAGMRAQQRLQEKTVEKWRDRLINARRALADDVAETQQAKNAMEQARSKLLQCKEHIESNSLDEATRAALLAEAEGYASTYQTAKARYEKELADDAKKQRQLEQVQRAYDQARAGVDQVKAALEAGVARMEEARNEAEAAQEQEAMMRELKDLEDPSGNLNIALAALNGVTADAERDLAEANLRMEEAGVTGESKPQSVLEQLEAKKTASAAAGNPWDVLD